MASQVESLVATGLELVRPFWVDPSIQAEENRRKATAQEIIDWLAEDRHGHRSAFLARWMHCPEGVIREAVEAEKPPPQIPRPIEYRRVAQNVLANWARGLDSQDIDRKLPPGEQIRSQTVIKFSCYIVEYLERCCINEIADLLKGVHSGAANTEYQAWVARYSEMVVDDFLVTPGPRCQAERHFLQTSNPFDSMRLRYEKILADRLAQGVEGSGTFVPQGNEELGKLIGNR